MHIFSFLNCPKLWVPTLTSSYVATEIYAMFHSIYRLQCTSRASRFRCHKRLEKARIPGRTKSSAFLTARGSSASTGETTSKKYFKDALMDSERDFTAKARATWIVEVVLASGRYISSLFYRGNTPLQQIWVSKLSFTLRRVRTIFSMTLSCSPRKRIRWRKQTIEIINLLL